MASDITVEWNCIFSQFNLYKEKSEILGRFIIRNSRIILRSIKSNACYPWYVRYLWRNQIFKQRTVVRNAVNGGWPMFKQRGPTPLRCWAWSPSIFCKTVVSQTFCNRVQGSADGHDLPVCPRLWMSLEKWGFLIIGKCKKCENELYAVKFG